MLIIFILGTVGVMYLQEGSTGNPSNTVTNSILLECEQGQYLSVLGSGTGAVYGQLGVQHSTLTIMLMHKYGVYLVIKVI